MQLQVKQAGGSVETSKEMSGETPSTIMLPALSLKFN
jgi:hypothetical protein